MDLADYWSRIIAVAPEIYQVSRSKKNFSLLKEVVKKAAEQRRKDLEVEKAVKAAEKKRAHKLLRNLGRPRIKTDFLSRLLPKAVKISPKRSRSRSRSRRSEKAEQCPSEKAVISREKVEQVSSDRRSRTPTTSLAASISEAVNKYMKKTDEKKAALLEEILESAHRIEFESKKIRDYVAELKE